MNENKISTFEKIVTGTAQLLRNDMPIKFDDVEDALWEYAEKNDITFSGYELEKFVNAINQMKKYIDINKNMCKCAAIIAAETENEPDYEFTYKILTKKCECPSLYDEFQFKNMTVRDAFHWLGITERDTGTVDRELLYN